MNTTNLSDGARSPDAIRSYVHLADGRRLSYTEWGQSAGRPVLEFRGLPSSHTGDAIDMAVLARAGVRRITVDRPGVGSSDPQAGRTLLDWPADVRGLANTLGLDSLAVPGTSGGRPYAAAGGSALSDRVTTSRVRS